jgi:hypothetical protein
MNHSPFTKLQELQLLVITPLGIQECLDLSTMILTKFHSTSFPSRWQLLWSSFSSFVVTRSSPSNNLFLFHILFSPLSMSLFPCVRSLHGHHLLLLLLLLLLGCFIFFVAFIVFYFFGSFCCCFCFARNSTPHNIHVLWLHYHSFLESSTCLKCLHWPKWMSIFFKGLWHKIT